MKNTLRALCIILSLLTAIAFAACNAKPSAPLGDAEGDPEAGETNGANGADDGYFSDNSASAGDNGSKPNGGDIIIGGSTVVTPDAGVTEDAEENVGNPPKDDAENNPEGEPDGDPDGAATESENNGGNTEPSEKADFITAPFVNTADNNTSTFSADVDTASYSYFRKLVSSGKYDFNALRNAGGSFRIEEFINYFRYDVPAAAEGELFGVYTEMTACPWNEDGMIFRLTLAAPEAPESAGNNLVFLIDVSGSMTTKDKLPLLKTAFSYLVGNLTPNDTVSIVTYSGKEDVVLDGCNGIDSEAIMEAIYSLKAGGSTNGQAGLSMAYQIAEKHFIEGGNNRIIMASDGDLNVGISSADELKSFIENKKDQGVYLSVLGFGTGNYRDENMEALADNGNGVYYYIDGESEAEKVFGTDLSGTLYTVANDVKLQIEFNSDAVEAYRLIGYDNRVLDNDDFENDAKDAGEVGAGHQVTVLYEIKLAEDAAEDADYMTLNVRYKNPGEEASRLNEYDLGSEIIPSEPTEETAFIISVAELAALLRNRNYDGDITVQTVAEALAEMELEDPYKAEFREMIQNLSK